MQTGYNNFWMYPNNRHEPVHNLPKNDNYNHPVLTNNYKQMQNGRYPSNTYFTPSNNVVRPQNGQYSTGPRCMWPSSVYSLPLNSSYVNNFQSQMFPNETNNFNYLSQPPIPKPAMRNSNVNALQKNNYNQRNVTTALPQIGNYTDTETARIRVKDVYTLNTNSVYNSVLENNLVQAQKNKEHEYPLNNASNNCNRTCDFETNEPVLRHIPSSYVQREQRHLNDQQQFLQYSDASYQQNVQLSSGSQIQSNGSRQVGNELQPTALHGRSMLLHMLRNRNRNVAQNNTLEGNERVASSPKETNEFNSLNTADSHIVSQRTNIDYRELPQGNETYGSYTGDYNFVQNENQANFQNIDPTSSLNEISSTEDSRIIAANTNGRISNLENNNIVKITIPHTGRSTYIQFNDLNNGDRNSSLNLPSLLESHNEVYREALKKNNTRSYIQNNGPNPLPEGGQVDSTSPGRNRTCNISSSIPNDRISTIGNSNYSYFNNNNNNNNSSSNNNNNNVVNNNNINNMRSAVSHSETTTDGRFQQESFDKRKHPETSFRSQDCPENTQENNSANISAGNENANNNEFSGDSQTESISSQLEVKQESLGVEDSSITIHEEIKTEKYSEDYEIEHKPRPSDNHHLSCKNDEGHAVASKEASLNKSPNKKPTTEQYIKDQEADLEVIKEKKYVSKINRDKLDLLIQFLKKEDEEKTKISDSADNVNKTCDTKKKKEVNLTRSRRKLNKTDIVKNKNNSREMVSLMSHKVSRAEMQVSSKLLKSLVSDGNRKKDEERKCCSDEKLGDLSEDVKCCNHSQKSENSDLKSESEIKNVSVSRRRSRGSVDEEKNIVNIMQALQKLKSHFCLSCTLISPMDSFWINVVSGELRCVNCFKKMNFKLDEDNLKLKRLCSGDCNKTDSKSPWHDKTQKVSENKKDTLENTPRSKCECEKSNESAKDNEERSCPSKHKNTEKKDVTPRKKIIDEQKKIEESEDKSSMSKDDPTFKTDDNSKLEIKSKRKLSAKEDFIPDKNLEEKTSPKIRKKSYSEESQTCVNYSKQWSDSPGKKNTIKEEKAKVHFDILKKEKKPFNQSSEKYTSKERSSVSRESSEQETSQRKDSENSVKQFKEEDVSEAGKRDKRLSSQSRRKSSSKEEVAHQKVRISEEESAFPMKSQSRESCESCKLQTVEVNLKRITNEPTDRSRCLSADQKAKISSKHTKSNPLEDSEKKLIHKNLEKLTELQLKKRRKSVEEVIPRKFYAAEDRTKYPKQSSEKTKSTLKACDPDIKHKTAEHSKHSVPDLDVPRRKSKDEELTPKEQSKTESKNLTESEKTRRNSTSKENLNSPQPKKEIKYKRLMLESFEKDKKTFLGKIPKISHKNTEKPIFEAYKSPQRDDKHPKSILTSKPLKESQWIEDETKLSTLSQVFKKKEPHENGLKQKEVLQRVGEKKKNGKTTEDIFEEVARSDKSHTPKQSKKEKALECIFGKRKDDLQKSPEKPPRLLDKFFDQTKKLSWSLLAE